MKEATILLKLTKDHHVTKTNVTPIEAMLLVAEHHRNVGEQPIEVQKDSIKDTQDKRTADQELDRLRTKYAASKVDVVASKVRDLPETFEDALTKGIRLQFPSTGLMSQPNSTTIASVKVL